MTNQSSKNFITYTINGSKTTESIINAPKEIQQLYQYLDFRGYNIAKIRNTISRFGLTEGSCMKGYHFGLVSLYKENENPKKQTSFGNALQRTQYRNLSVLRLPRNYNTKYIFRAIEKIEDKHFKVTILDKILRWLPKVA